MDRRSLLLGGVALGAGAAVHAVDTRQVSGPAARSTRPHSGVERAVAARVVWHAAPDRRQVALTFDDGPDPRWTPLVLDLLARHGVPATFMVVGSRAHAHADLLSRTADAGHELGNHTWTHADLCRVSPAKVEEELARTSELLEARTGRAPTVLRPPWGHIDAVGLMAAADLGCDVLMWSELIRGADATTDLAQTLRDVRAGSVVLAHDGGPTPTAAELRAVDTLVGTLRDRGYTFATVTELLDVDRLPTPSPELAAVALPEQRSLS